MDSPGCENRCKKEKKQGWADANQRPEEERRKRKRGGGERRGWGWEGAGVALHASHSIRRSRVCPVHVDVSLRASVAGERQELPRA